MKMEATKFDPTINTTQTSSETDRPSRYVNRRQNINKVVSRLRQQIDQYKAGKQQGDYLATVMIVTHSGSPHIESTLRGYFPNGVIDLDSHRFAVVMTEALEVDAIDFWEETLRQDFRSQNAYAATGRASYQKDSDSSESLYQLASSRSRRNLTNVMRERVASAYSRTFREDISDCIDRIQRRRDLDSPDQKKKRRSSSKFPCVA